MAVRRISRLNSRRQSASLRMNPHDEQGEVIVATTRETVEISGIVPTLTVDDLQKSIAFYEALGFAIDERWEDNGTLLGVMLRAGRIQIGLNQDDWKKGRDRKKGIGVRLAIATTRDNVDEIARRARSAGIMLKSEPHDTEWESRAFEVIDPTGFLLTIFSEPSA
jgi:uncharacterized glyoxalase superfamily protein PhnB